MNELLGRLSDLASGMPFRLEIASSALDIDRSVLGKMMSDDESVSSNAKGIFLENYVYEYFKRSISNEDFIKFIIRKGKDAEAKEGKYSKRRKNGFAYSKKGLIFYRGNGQDLAEFDMLMLPEDKTIVLIEVTNSKLNLDGLTDEIKHKKSLIQSATGLAPVVMFISPLDLHEKHPVREFAAEENNIFVHLKELPDLTRELITEFSTMNTRSTVNNKLAGLDAIPLNPEFSYDRLVKENEENVIQQIAAGKSAYFIKRGVKQNLVSNLFLFTLQVEKSKLLLDELTYFMRNDQISTETMRNCFSSIVVGLSLPYFRPTLYFKLKGRRHYLKFVPNGRDEFRFSGIIPHSPNGRIPTKFLSTPETGYDAQKIDRLSLRVTRTFYREELIKLKEGRSKWSNFVEEICPGLFGHK